VFHQQVINLGIHVASKYFEMIPDQIMFLGPSLAFAVVYIWSRRNPNMRMSFLGLFTFNAPYLPWVLIGFGLMLGQSPFHDVLGAFAQCALALNVVANVTSMRRCCCRTHLLLF
jgi:hypothetical protein